MVPVTSGNPSTGRQLRAKATDSLGKLLGSRCVSEVNARELKTTVKEVNVRVVKAGDDELAPQVDHPR